VAFDMDKGDLVIKFNERRYFKKEVGLKKEKQN
jgi:hypothetical protein